MRLAHTLYVIRHGETDWNREQRFQGQTDIPLNALGRSQARRNGEALAALGVDFSGFAFVSSPLVRAADTMRIARTAMGLEPDAFSFDDRLKEVSYGDWERHTLSELERTVPEAVAAREADKWRFTPPNGESYADLCDRVKDYAATLNGPTLIATHGGVLRSLFHLVEGVDGPAAANRPVWQDRIYAIIDGRGGWLPRT